MTLMRFTVRLLMTVILLFLFNLSVEIEAKTPPFKDLDRPRLVEAAEVMAVAAHPLVRIVDMRSSLDGYLKGHIPNAVHLHFENLRVSRQGIPAQLPDKIVLEKLIGESLGISNNMWVILYSERSNPNATFFLWTLDYLGHKKVGVLDGGWEKWEEERLPQTQAHPPIVPKKFFGRIKGENLADKKRVLRQLSAPNGLVIDARSPAQYSGEEGDEIRRGHIPGARNLFWESVLEGNETRIWKKKEDLERLFAEAGIARDKDIIVYCRTGREASHLYFTLKYVLRFPIVRLYRGSWLEWSADPTLSIRTGMQP